MVSKTTFLKLQRVWRQISHLTEVVVPVKSGKSFRSFNVVTEEKTKCCVKHKISILSN